MWKIALVLLALVVVRITHWFYTWANPKGNGKLPPGSMGLPIIGETFQFLSQHGLYDVPPFITKRMARYGPLFRTNLFGQKVIVSTDPEVNYKILQENKTFPVSYPESFLQIMGRNGMLTSHENFHKYLRNLILHLVGPENLRAKLLHGVDQTTRRHLHSWAGCGIYDVKEGAALMIFDYFCKKLISYDETQDVEKLREYFKDFMDGLLSFPLNIPGTAFDACLQGRKEATKVIEDIYQERKASKIYCDDFMDHLVAEVEKEDSFMDETNAINLVFLLLFAVYETTSQAITLLVKYIFDNPDVSAELTKEHEGILRSRKNGNKSEVTWEEYKSMTFSHMVINETVRLANIVPGLFRKVSKDVQIKGYTIPAGWLVMVASSVVHFTPEKYEDPLAFNPWRWEGKELHAGSKSFMAFGGGTRLCAGADLAKLQMAVFLHYLVTTYSWSIIKGGDGVRKPGLIFPNGLHIQILEK